MTVRHSIVGSQRPFLTIFSLFAAFSGSAFVAHFADSLSVGLVWGIGWLLLSQLFAHPLDG